MRMRILLFLLILSTAHCSIQCMAQELPDSANRTSCTAFEFMEAVRRGDTVTIQNYFKKYPHGACRSLKCDGNVCCQRNKKFTAEAPYPLLYAARYGNEVIMDLVVKQISKPDEIDEAAPGFPIGVKYDVMNWTALCVAFKYHNQEAASVLLNHWANPHHREKLERAFYGEKNELLRIIVVDLASRIPRIPIADTRESRHAWGEREQQFDLTSCERLKLNYLEALDRYEASVYDSEPVAQKLKSLLLLVRANAMRAHYHLKIAHLLTMPEPDGTPHVRTPLPPEVAERIALYVLPRTYEIMQQIAQPIGVRFLPQLFKDGTIGEPIEKAIQKS